MMSQAAKQYNSQNILCCRNQSLESAANWHKTHAFQLLLSKERSTSLSVLFTSESIELIVHDAP